ncbi:MAG: 4Fe-4S binding protein [Humidesulfovibrio sp.]|nr:4Fe-4S binding protein [Humidesulfovibrio sp.]
MDIDSITLVYFSPTRTTRRIVEGVALGLRAPEVQTIDLTPAEAARQTFSANPRGLTVIGSPVYAGRIPADMLARFRNIKGCGGPAVVLVAYGNRAYEDALLELRDLALNAGFQPIAAGAFIGEHSYSQETTPIAQGRPDRADMEEATAFGELVREKLRRLSTLASAPPIHVPGNFPYKELSLSSGIAPVTDAAKCSRCGECISLCPVGAISADDPTQARADRCIRCCACVKFCPSGAKVMDHAKVNQFREYLTLNHKDPKKPETYL